MRDACVFWFTGLSGSGKTTVAEAAAQALKREGREVTIFDGDQIRKVRHAHLGFTKPDIYQNNRAIAEWCLERKSKSDIILVPIISPYAEHRLLARNLIAGRFYEIYFRVKLKTVIARDVKGLYAKAARGEISNLIGYSPLAPYEPPRDADLVLDTDCESIEVSTRRLMEFVQSKVHEVKLR